MGTLVTEAIVLHSFDYLETSRIVRLLTRDAGIQSVIARGARSSRKRFGGALDLFAQGTAEIHMKDNRDLHSLASLDITRSRGQLAMDVGRFTGASMIAELTLRSSSDEEAMGLFDAIEQALDRLSLAPPEKTVDVSLGGAWSIIAALGFTPSIDVCANCHANLDPALKLVFSNSAGGALCSRCGSLAAGARVLPASARDALRAWIDGADAPSVNAAEARAHQRLLREFVLEHLGTGELRAFRVWEHGEWSAA
jgi:DNA repair protein RecO (recombination protein O)